MEQDIDTQNLMKPPQLIMTQDGSHSLWMPELKESYHSTYGAIQEARHVFIRHGLLHWLNVETRSSVHILEVGLGTGLNALLTYLTSLTSNVQIAYTGLEPFPIPYKYVRSLNYATQLTQQKTASSLIKTYEQFLRDWHQGTTTTSCSIADNFLLNRINDSLQSFSTPPNTFDIVYFDAFSPNKQPIIWSRSMLKKVHQMMRCRGVMVTYCA